MSGRPSPSFLHGVAAALALSLSGAALYAALAPMLGAAAALRAVVVLLAAAYVLYLLAQSAERTGRITTVVVWLAATAAAWLLEPPLAAFVLLEAGMIWLVRCLYHHSSMLTALVDLGLTMLAVAFAAWAASRSGSPWLALWCFFLVQAFFVLLPSGSDERAAAATRADGGEAFERAHRAAHAALHRMTVQR